MDFFCCISSLLNMLDLVLPQTIDPKCKWDSKFGILKNVEVS